MSDGLLCLLAILIAVASIIAVLVLGLSCNAQKGFDLRDFMEEYKQCSSWDEKAICATFGLFKLMKMGFWGFLTAFSVSVGGVASAVCGYSPIPWLLEFVDRLLAAFETHREAENSANAS